MLKRDPAQRTTTEPLVVILRTFGTMDMLALIAVIMPPAWFVTGHQWCGLGAFPDTPLTMYLARSASLMYGLHGVFLFLLATDIARYEKLIRWIAAITVLHGGVMVAIDVLEQMPLWWTVVEGPAFSLTGIVILLAQRISPTQSAHASGSPPEV